MTIRKYGNIPSGLFKEGLLVLAFGVFCVGNIRAAYVTTPASPQPMAVPTPAVAGSSVTTPAVVVSSAAAPMEPGVNDLYPLDKMHLRDPFAQLGGSSGGYGQLGEVPEFSIHNLVLKGIMQDASGDFALFVDAGSGANYVLRKDVLYDIKRKPVPGVSGIIKPRQKTVHLLTLDKDVQTFILGEERGPE